MNEQVQVQLPDGVGTIGNITKQWLRGELDSVPMMDQLAYFADHVWPMSQLRQVPAVASSITALFNDNVRHWEFVTRSKLALSLRPPGNPVNDMIEKVVSLVDKASDAEISAELKKPSVWDELANAVRQSGFKPEPEVKLEDVKRIVSVRGLSETLTYDNIVTVDVQQNYVVLYVDAEFGGARYIYNRDEIKHIEIEPDVQLIEDQP